MNRKDADPVNDPIVAEVHRLRARMWADCGEDLDRLIDFLRAGEAEHRDRIISKAELADLRRHPRSVPAGPRAKRLP
ncbi:MAG: hypothetical protein AB1716_15680 [Planctomycetota bacterium]